MYSATNPENARASRIFNVAMIISVDGLLATPGGLKKHYDVESPV